MPSRSEAAADPAETESSLIGRRVRQYEIVRAIGRGGMGTVYEALNTTIGKRVAMKFIDAAAIQNKDAVARFQREAQAASAVESAHIVEIFDAGFSEDGLPFIVMELLRGEDLGHRIKRCGRLDLPEAVHVVAQILRGLNRAHEAGIVHRDLKPDNVFLVERDDDANFAKVLDFGISKVQRPGQPALHTLTRQGTVLGTPFYMSPEQAQALPDIDGRTDLWSVGAILYECLAGRPPSSGTTYEQVIVNICMTDAEDIRTHNPGVPEPVAQLLRKALSRERDGRFQTARDLLDALGVACGGLVSSRPRGVEGLPALTAAAMTPRHTPALARAAAGSKDAAQDAGSEPPDGFEPTLEVQNGNAVSRVGWSTSPGRVARRDRRVYLFVGAGALLLGGLGALAFGRHPSPFPPPSPLAQQAASGAQGPLAPAAVEASGRPAEPAAKQVEPQAAPEAPKPSAAPLVSVASAAPATKPEPEVKHRGVPARGTAAGKGSPGAPPPSAASAVPVAPRAAASGNGVAAGLTLQKE